LSYKALQFPTRNSVNKFTNSNLVITYNNYVITNIELGDDGLYHGTCNYKNAIYSLRGATLDLLVQDLIEGNEEENTEQYQYFYNTCLEVYKDI
jgi:hypothetical protein